MKNKTLSYLIAVAYIVLVAVLGATFTNMGVDMLNTLSLPSQWIGGTVISIVWTIIYISLAIYLILLIRNNQLTVGTIVLVLANGIFNVLWCALFFAMGSLIGGQIVIVINAVLAVLLVVDAYNKNSYYAYIAIYPLWLLLATCLNTAVWILN